MFWHMAYGFSLCLNLMVLNGLIFKEKMSTCNVPRIIQCRYIPCIVVIQHFNGQIHANKISWMNLICYIQYMYSVCTSRRKVLLSKFNIISSLLMSYILLCIFFCDKAIKDSIEFSNIYLCECVSLIVTTLDIFHGKCVHFIEGIKKRFVAHI